MSTSCRVGAAGGGSGLFATRDVAAGGTVLRVARSDIFEEVFPTAAALEARLAATGKLRDAQHLLEHIVPGLTGKYYLFRPESMIFYENHSDAPNCTGMTYDWLDGADGDAVLTKVALRPIAAGDEITVDYNACSGYDVRADDHMRRFLGLCRRFGVTKQPSVFRAMEAAESAWRNRPTTDPRHREALFVVPRDCILEEAMAENWRAVAALTRCNVVTICKGAQHGWIGASFSCLDILICLHQRMSDAFDSVVLAKGHAAAAQYAVLYSTGEMSAEMLRQYKNGKDTPEAHADILCDTGSLGQCLSTVAGMASAAPHKHFGVVLGDGELQEGQNFEALMSIRHHNIANLTIIVDRNGFQSDNRTKDIMPIHDLPRVLEGFGFTVLHVPDGHDPETLRESIVQTIPNSGGSLGKSDGDRPNLYVIIADTSKAAPPLTSHMMPSVHPEGLLHQPWHTKVPTWDVYIAVVEEQLAMAQSASASARWYEHKASREVGRSRRTWQLQIPTDLATGALGQGKSLAMSLYVSSRRGKMSLMG